MDIFLRGLLIGFSIAAPVGPIGVLCIRRTLAEGRLTGFLSGLGAASADMLYGAVAAFGLTAVQDLLVGQQVWLRLIGGVFLAYLFQAIVADCAGPGQLVTGFDCPGQGFFFFGLIDCGSHLVQTLPDLIRKL